MACWPRDKDSALGHGPSYLQNIHRIVYIADHATICHTQGHWWKPSPRCLQQNHPGQSVLLLEAVALGEADAVQAESLTGPAHSELQDSSAVVRWLFPTPDSTVKVLGSVL